jgi:hypothetical protein
MFRLALNVVAAHTVRDVASFLNPVLTILLEAPQHKNIVSKRMRAHARGSTSLLRSKDLQMRARPVYSCTLLFVCLNSDERDYLFQTVQHLLGLRTCILPRGRISVLKASQLALQKDEL